jgi:MFS transporter, DHA2 family, multidrug resistance protein
VRRHRDQGHPYGPANGAAAAGETPPRSGLVLATLILSATVANLNLAVANVALPTIGKDLGATQTLLDAVAIGFTLGLAASVLYLGALADRHGRKLMLLLGLSLSIPAAALAAWAPTVEVLIGARVFGGVAAGMAFPTTLSLITALFGGRRRTKAIALWSGIGGGASAIGPLAVGLLLTRFWWGSAFVLTIPLAALAIILAIWLVPRRAGESSERVDDLGGILSVITVAALVLGLNFASAPRGKAIALTCGAVVLVALLLFIWRERRAANPIFDLHVARRRVFWVAALAGIIAFGALMGSLFIGQQFLQDVLGYSALEAGAAVLPSPILMIALSPVAARLITKRGARLTLIIAFVFIGAGFTVMLTWKAGIGYPLVGVAYALVGAGIGLGGAPASRSVMSAVPIRRAGMGSATTDLQRDLGGAIMQSILGALLAVRYAHYFAEAFAGLPPDQMQKLGEDAAATIQSSFGGAEQVAALYPQAQADQIIAAARQAFTEGSHVAITAALCAIGAGLLLVILAFPGKRREDELEAGYARADAARSDGSQALSADAEHAAG